MRRFPWLGLSPYTSALKLFNSDIFSYSSLCNPSHKLCNWPPSKNKSGTIYEINAPLPHSAHPLYLTALSRWNSNAYLNIFIKWCLAATQVAQLK